MCVNSYESSVVVKRRLSQIFLANTLKKITTHYTSPLIVNICSPIFEHCTPLSYSSFTHYILAVNRRVQFTMDFHGANFL
jgi:hypothetical protein